MEECWFLAHYLLMLQSLLQTLRVFILLLAQFKFQFHCMLTAFYIFQPS